MKMTQLNCFCTEQPNSGNPAAVVENFEGDSADKQLLSRELNLPVTVFITEKVAAASKLAHANQTISVLEFFYPLTTMPLCLHGVLAAAKILGARYGAKCFVGMTANDKMLSITQSESRDDFFGVEVAEQPLNYDSSLIDRAQVYRLLRLSASDASRVIATDLPLVVASVGSPKLLVPVCDLQQLLALQPDYSALSAWSTAMCINGIYAYTQNTYAPSANFHARGFNPKSGHHEDAATGVAAAALASVLQRNIVVEQGHCIGKPCMIEAEYLGMAYSEVHGTSIARILIGGRVIAH